MAVVGYAAQGTLPNATTGAQVRVAIVSSTNASPIVVDATSHGFNTGDSIEIEGHATNTAANGQWQITKVDANHFALNGSTGNGVGGATGYAIDYQLQPAIQIPSPGDAASMVTLAPVLEGNANPAPYLYRRLGKWRLYNQYLVLKGNLPPYLSNPWSTQSGLTPGSFTAFNGAQWSLESLCDTTSLPPYSGANELWVFNVNYSALITPSANNLEAVVAFGAQISSGTGINMLGQPVAIASSPVNSSIARATFPIGLSGAFESNFAASNLYLTLTYLVDSLASGTVSLDLLGTLTGSLLQYRQN